jgi:hypothetical protein
MILIFRKALVILTIKLIFQSFYFYTKENKSNSKYQSVFILKIHPSKKQQNRVKHNFVNQLTQTKTVGSFLADNHKYEIGSGYKL